MATKRRRLSPSTALRGSKSFQVSHKCEGSLESDQVTEMRRVPCKHVWGALPPDIIATVLCEHFTLEDLAVLDCSLTNHSLRSFFFQQVYPRVILSRHTILKCNAAARWMRVRGVRGRHFEFWHGVSKGVLSSFFKLHSSAENGAQFLSLNLTGYDYLTNMTLRELAVGSPNMVSLNLSYCSDLTDEGIKVLAQHCPRLQTLILWGCYELTNATVLALAAHCSSITNLNLRCCRNINDDGLAMLASGFRAMTSLNFTYCNKITDAGVRSLARSFPMLQRLSFAYCSLISDESVRLLSQLCPHLEYLDLTQCNIGDDALCYIARSGMAHSIRELFISSCNKVTDVGILQLGLRCRQLSTFHVSGCEHVSVAALQMLPRTCTIHNDAFGG